MLPNYTKPNVSEKWLEENRFYRYFKDGEDICYKHTFPVYRDSGGFVSIECRLLLWVPSGQTRVDILDAHSKGCVAFWYDREYGSQAYSLVIDKIETAVDKEIKRLGINQI